MAVNIDLSGVVQPIPSVCTQLDITLPGGLTVQGSAPYLGASPLDAARATIASAMSALAPLGPIFKILEAVLSIVSFAESVPKVVYNPGAVVTALKDVLKKAAAMASLVPQLSMPLMILDVVDTVIAFLNGLSDEVSRLADIESELGAATALAAEVPALLPIVSQVTLQVEAQRARISCGISDTGPLLDTISQLGKLIGLPPIAISGDASSGSLEDLSNMLDDMIKVLTDFRALIPIP